MDVSVITKLLVFFCVLFFVETMFPEKIDSVVSLVIVFAVDALETVRARFTLFSSKVHFAILSEMFVVFDFVGLLHLTYLEP